MNENPYADLEKKQNEYMSKQDEYIGEQKKIQDEQVQANTDFLIGQIEQQKQYADEDLSKEGKSAYVDYQKSLNPYGVQAEAIASQGLGRTGYSESSQVKNYNAYQNRVSVAKQTTMRIKADFDNKINEAKLTGNTEKAKIALQEYQQRMQLLQQDLNFTTDITDKKIADNKWQTEYNYRQEQDKISQANWEKSFLHQQEQARIAQSNWEKEYARLGKSYSGGGGYSNSSRNNGYSVNDYTVSDRATTQQQNTVAKNTNEFEGYNMKSVLDLGYGAISKARLQELIQQKKVIATIQNGKITVTKNPMFR